MTLSENSNPPAPTFIDCIPSCLRLVYGVHSLLSAQRTCIWLQKRWIIKGTFGPKSLSGVSVMAKDFPDLMAGTESENT